MGTTAAPIADWVDLAALADDPYPTYARLRESAPVAFVPQLNRYFVTRFRDCFDVEMDQQTFSSYENAETSTMIRAMGRPLLRRDDPDHKVQRNAMAPALRPLTLKKVWNAIFRANAEKYVERLRDEGSGADLFQHFAVPYAADNLSALIGIGEVDPYEVMRWSHALIRGVGNITGDPEVWAETDEVCTEIDDSIDRALMRVRRAPDASIISAMQAAGLPDNSLRANVRLAISGGLNEPSHVISSAVWCLSAFPEQRRHLDAGASSWRDVFEETARFHSPVGMYPRRTTRDVELGGVLIPEASTVAIVVAAANRDARHYELPDVFDVRRESVSHLAFGNGTHICAGNWAARAMVGEIALPVLYERLPGLTARDPDAVDFRGWVFRGATHLPVEWTR